jgi:lipoyl(octanoyl) transferase
MRSQFLGKFTFQKGLDAQEAAAFDLDETSDPAIVLGMEHDPVITLGVRGNTDIDLLISSDEIAARGFQIVKTNRGGQATIHNPGQLVIYPICNLKILGLGARDYVCLIERSTGSWLASLGLAWSRKVNEPGFFVDGRKLVAFGFRISKSKTSHGLAINVDNRLTDFELIRTCGIREQPVTSLVQLGLNPAGLGGLQGIFAGWMNHFKANLEDLESFRSCIKTSGS